MNIPNTQNTKDYLIATRTTVANVVAEVFTFEDEKDSVELKNIGNDNITLTISGTDNIVAPGETYFEDGLSTLNVTVSAASDSQGFTIVGIKDQSCNTEVDELSEKLDKLTPEVTDVGLYPQVNSEGGFDFVVVGGGSGINGQSIFALDVSTQTGTDTEKIQAALDVGGVIIINKKDAINTPWDITAPLEIGSNTTLIVNDCELKLANNVDDPILKNKDIVTGNENIHVIGWGQARFNCNGGNQDRLLDNYHNIGIHFYLVNDFSFSNIIIEETAKWGLVPEACNRGRYNNIKFENSGVVNQDGLHIIGPSDDHIANGIYGTFGDDACVCNGRDNPYQGYSSTGGDVTNVIFNNGNVEGGSSGSKMGGLRTSAGQYNKVENVIFSNFICKNVSEGAARLGGGDSSTLDTHKNIQISNVTVESSNVGDSAAMVYCVQNVGDVKISNCTLIVDDNNSDPGFVKNVGKLLIGLSVSNCRMLTKSGKNGRAFNFTGNAVKDVLVNGFSLYSLSGTSGTDFLYIDNPLINAQFNNINVEGCDKGVVATSSASPTNVRISNLVTRNNSGVDYDLADGNYYVINGYAKESANAEEPTNSKFQIGDIIEFTDSGDASGNGTYLKTADSTFLKLV